MVGNPFKIKEFTGKHMLAVIFLFFGTIITVNMILAWFAISNWSGLVVKNSYVASQQFNEKLAEVDRQKKFGWKSTVRVKNGSLLFLIKDASNTAITDLTVKVIIGRPAVEKFDHTVQLTQTIPGTYKGTAPEQGGLWRFDVRAVTADGQKYRQVFRLELKPENG